MAEPHKTAADPKVAQEASPDTHRVTATDLPRDTVSPQVSQPDVAWRDHEHVAETAQLPAQQLLAATGSPDLAKQAIDVAHERQEGAATDEETSLAKAAGYDSVDSLRHTATAISDRADSTWWIAPTQSQMEWIAWRSESPGEYHRFASRESALRWVNEQ